MKKIKLTQGKYALVDNEDFKQLNQFRWYYNLLGYAEHKDSLMSITIHRFILKLKKGDNKIVDHINGNKLDNRKVNLRLCTHSQNLANRSFQKNTTTGYKGVCYQKEKSGKIYIKAQIMVNQKNIHIGLFKTTKEAALAYNQAAIKYFGKFAQLNKIT